jgi:nucleoside-diphosphate-sugar epimerase
LYGRRCVRRRLPRSVLAHHIARIYERRLISHLYPGGLSTGQPYLHVDDLADALMCIVEHRKELPDELPLLLGEAEAISFGELQRLLGQLIHGVWEPFFAGDAARNGTEYIVTSQVSKARPIADGGLGAVSYMFEVLMGVMGDRRRWRTMPGWC